MRPCVPLVILALLAVPAAAARDTAVYVGPAGAAAVHLEGAGNLLAWPPAPGAVAYDVYRLEADGAATLLGTTSTPSFLDSNGRSGEEILYRIVAITAQGETTLVEIATKGECIARRGLTGVAITLSNCKPDTES